MGHNIYFKGGIWKTIPKLFFLPLLIWSTDLIVNSLVKDFDPAGKLTGSHNVVIFIIA